MKCIPYRSYLPPVQNFYITCVSIYKITYFARIHFLLYGNTVKLSFYLSDFMTLTELKTGLQSVRANKFLSILSDIAAFSKVCD